MRMQTNFELARRNMVENQIRCCRVLKPEIIELFLTMPREAFVPEEVRSIAYMEGHVPLPAGQEMLTPLQEAHILQALNLSENDRVLEIGTGCGFFTAMLAMMAGSVVSCEIHGELAEMARKNLREHGIENAKVIEINAMDEAEVDACAELAGPFDALVVGAAVEEAPQHLLRRLSPQGRAALFLGKNPVVRLEVWRSSGEGWQKLGLMETDLLPIEGAPVKREFVF